MAVKKVKVVFSSDKNTADINKFLNELAERLGNPEIKLSVKPPKKSF